MGASAVFQADKLAAVVDDDGTADVGLLANFVADRTSFRSDRGGLRSRSFGSLLGFDLAGHFGGRSFYRSRFDYGAAAGAAASAHVASAIVSRVAAAVARAVAAAVARAVALLLAEQPREKPTPVAAAVAAAVAGAVAAAVAAVRNRVARSAASGNAGVAGAVAGRITAILVATNRRQGNHQNGAKHVASSPLKQIFSKPIPNHSIQTFPSVVCERFGLS